jgi:hypothetical protein
MITELEIESLLKKLDKKIEEMKKDLDVKFGVAEWIGKANRWYYEEVDDKEVKVFVEPKTRIYVATLLIYDDDLERVARELGIPSRFLEDKRVWRKLREYYILANMQLLNWSEIDKMLDVSKKAVEKAIKELEKVS